MSDARRVAQASDSSAELHALIFDSIHEGVFTVDDAYRITTFNREAERITGVSRRQAIGKKCYEVFRASICQHGCAMKETLVTGRPLRDVRIDVLNEAMLPVPLMVSTAVLRRGDRLVGGVEIFRDISDLESLRKELKGNTSFEDIVGASPVMQDLFRLLPDVAASNAPVLIEGPSGTGKELVAGAIHSLSVRRDKPLVRVNCGALPDTLLESELFGYVRGAFTDARGDKPGHFALADGGTILLDEIGDVTPAFQLKLLRVLQEGEIQPLGGRKPVKVDVRVLAATNRNLAKMVDEGKFRQDLYYRIRVVPVVLAPLKERREDVPLLVDHFIRRLALKTGKNIRDISPKALAVLQEYDFPGNVRELQNILERAFILCHGQRIELRDLPNEIVNHKIRATMADGRADAGRKPSERTLLKSSPVAKGTRLSEDAVAQRLLEALTANAWDRTKTARSLGIGRNTLWRRMKEHGLGPSRRQAARRGTQIA